MHIFFIKVVIFQRIRYLCSLKKATCYIQCISVPKTSKCIKVVLQLLILYLESNVFNTVLAQCQFISTRYKHSTVKQAPSYVGDIGGLAHNTTADLAAFPVSPRTVRGCVSRDLCLTSKWNWNFQEENSLFVMD